MKVAIYSGGIPSTTFIENLINVVASNGTRVFLFGTRNSRVKYKFPNVSKFPTPSSSWKRLFFVLYQLTWAIIFYQNRIFKIYKHVNSNWSWGKKIKWLSKTLPVINHLPDVFHVQWAKSASDWLFLKEMFGVKLVLSLRGAHIDYSPICDPELAETYRNTFPKYDAFHAVSKAIAKEAEKYGADPSKIKVIYSGVDLELISKIKKEVSSIRQKTKSSNNQRLNIISVGRFHWKKGYTYSIDACKILKDKGVNFKYTIIATGDSQEYLYQIEDLDLNDYIEIIPEMSHEDTLKQIASSDVLLLPSIEEGIANVVLEAMALGVYVISTDCGGMKEVIDNGVNGTIVPKYSSIAIADSIHLLIGSPENVWHNITEVSKSIIQEKFNITNSGKEMINLYRSLNSSLKFRV